ncbi:hypothetical protein BH11ACT8_BH11ACT8_04240 [soil metagenome]
MAHVLVVDDDPDIRELLRLTIDMAGHVVTTASDGIHGLERLSQDRFDVVVLDGMMPRMSGLELLQRLRAGACLTQPFVMMISAHNDACAVRDALAAGADEYWAKPFSVVDLRKRIDAILPPVSTR